jgi:hypothetical protein
MCVLCLGLCTHTTAAQALLKPKGITYKPEVTVATDSVKLLPPNS